MSKIEYFNFLLACHPPCKLHGCLITVGVTAVGSYAQGTTKILRLTVEYCLNQLHAIINKTSVYCCERCEKNLYCVIVCHKGLYRWQMISTDGCLEIN